jgi:hypothetical protein
MIRLKSALNKYSIEYWGRRKISSVRLSPFQNTNTIIVIAWVGLSKTKYWRKPPRNVLYKRTFGMPDQGQTLDMWESETTESALRWQTRHIAPCRILELTLEVILEVILDHVLGIKIMTFLILDHVARAYLYLGISTGEKVMILLLSHSLGVVTGHNKT